MADSLANAKLARTTNEAAAPMVAPPSMAAAPPAVADLQNVGDAQLVHAAQGKQPEAFAAFETLVRRYHTRLFGLVLSMVKVTSDADEVMQDAFLQIFRAVFGGHGPTFVDVEKKVAEQKARSWLYRITVNAALMHLRKSRRQPILHLGHDPDIKSDEGLYPMAPAGAWAKVPDKALLDRELGDTLTLAMAHLPDKYRLVLYLSDVEEHTGEDIAQTLGITLPTVKARLHRARARVRHAMLPYVQKGRGRANDAATKPSAPASMNSFFQSLTQAIKEGRQL